MSSVVIAALGLVGIVAAMVVVGRHRGKQIAVLAERGVPAPATISRRRGRSKGSEPASPMPGRTVAGMSASRR